MKNINSSLFKARSTSSNYPTYVVNRSIGAVGYEFVVRSLYHTFERSTHEIKIDSIRVKLGAIR